MADTGQKFIRRNRAPRVHISYDDPYDADRKVELPFVMGVLADLSGNNSGRREAGSRASATSSSSTWTTSTSAWPRSSPASPSRSTTSSATATGEKLSVDLSFARWTTSRPAAVARQVPSLARLLEARQQLSNLLRYMDGKVAASDQIKALLADPQLMAALKERLNERPATGDETE